MRQPQYLKGLLRSAALALAATIACEPTAPNPQPTQLAFETQPVNGTAGALLTSIRVSVRDASGLIVASTPIEVTIALSGGDATLNGPRTVTSVDGIASFTTLAIEKAGTGYTLTVSANGLTGATSNQFAIQHAPPAKLVLLTQPSNVAAGSTISPGVGIGIQDAFGNTATSATNQVAVAITIGTANGATLSGTTQKAAVAGGATFGDLGMTKAGSGYTLTATSIGLTPVTSTAFGVVAGAAAKLAMVAQPASTLAASAINPAVRVAVQDAFDNVVTGATATVNASIATGTGASGATLDGTVTASPTDGIVAFSNLSIKRAALGYALRFEAAGLTAAQTSAFNVAAGNASRLSFVSQPGTALAGAAFGALQVEVQDAAGNLVGTSSASITIAVTSGTGVTGAVLTGPLTRTASLGSASFSGLSLSKAGAGYTLTVTSAPLVAATSAAFTVNPGVATNLGFVVQPANGVAGAALTPDIQVAIQDASGNTVSGTVADVALSITAGTGAAGSVLTGTTTRTSAGGIAAFANLALAKAGTGYTLTATATGLTSAVSSTFGIVAGAATKLGIITHPIAASGGSSMTPSLVVAVQDALGNTVQSTHAVTVTITGGTGAVGAVLTGTVTRTTASGLATTFDGLAIGKVGTGYTLTATSPGMTPATTNAFDVIVGPAAALAFTTQPIEGVVSSALAPVRVGLRDAGGNDVTAAAPILIGVVVTPGSGTPPGAALGGGTNQSTLNGVAAFTNISVGQIATGVTLTASASGLTPVTSASFNVTAGSGNVLEFTVQPSTTPVLSTMPSVQVSIKNSGSVVTSATHDVTVAIQSGSGHASAVLSGTVTRAAVAGVATFDNLAINQGGTGYALVATSPTNASVASASFNISAPATQIVLTTAPSTTSPSRAVFAAQPVIQVQTASGDAAPLSGLVVTAAIASGGGTLGGTTTATTSSTGAATFTNLSIAGTVGSRSLSFSAGSFAPASANVSVTAGAATTIALEAGNNQFATPQTTVPVPPSVKVVDADNNPVPGLAVTFAVTGGGGSVTGENAITNALGIATLLSWTLGTPLGTNTLTASASGLTGSPVQFTATASVFYTVTLVGTGSGGSGVVTSANPGLNCTFTNGVVSGTCSIGFPDGAAVTLTAVPATNNVMFAWMNNLAIAPNTGGFAGSSATPAEMAGCGSPLTGGANTSCAFTVTANRNIGVGWYAPAQTSLSESFTDVNYTSSPAWTGYFPDGGTTTLQVESVQHLVVSRAAAGGLTREVMLALKLDIPVTDLSQLSIHTRIVSSSVSAGGATNLEYPSIVRVRVRNAASALRTIYFAFSSTGGSVPANTVDTKYVLTPIATNTFTSHLFHIRSYLADADRVVGIEIGGIGTEFESRFDELQFFQSNGLVSQYLMNNAVSDVMGNPTPPALVGSPTFTTGKDGSANGALALNGVDQWVVIPGAKSTSLPSGTISIWAKSATSTTPAKCDRLDLAGPNPFACAYNIFTKAVGNDRSFGMQLGGPPGIVNTFAFLLNGETPLSPPAFAYTYDQWHLYTFAWDGTTKRMYFDGAQVASAVNSGVSATGDLYLGNNGTTGLNTRERLEGALDDLQIYNRALSAAEIAALYTPPAGAPSKLGVITPPAAARNRIAFTTQPTVQVQDAAGNSLGVSGVVVTAAITAGAPTLINTTSATTNSLGLATFSDLAIQGVVGQRTITFSASGLTSATAVIDVIGGTATTIALNAGSNQTANAGAAVGVSPSVLVSDIDGNPVVGATVNFTVASGGGSVAGPTQITNAAGIATVGTWSLGAVPGTNTLTATSGSLSGSPVTFTATAVPTALTNDAPVTGVTGAISTNKYYKIVVPAGQAQLNVNITGGTGDADLYVRRGSLPTDALFDCRPFLGGNSETCAFTNPASGDWFIMLNGFSAYTGVTLKATYTGAPNLFIDNVYLVQATQTPTRTVPLLTGRSALVRVFGKASASNTAQPNVRVRLYRNGGLVQTYTATPGAAGVATTIDQGSLNGSWNVTIPANEMTLGLSILADIDPTNAFAEPNETDNVYPTNSIPLALDVRNTPTFSVMFVPVLQQPNGRTGDVTDANKGTFLDYAQRVLPISGVSATVHAVYNFTGDISATDGTEWSRLISELNTMRTTESSTALYYGVVRPATSSGILGVGYVGGFAAAGVDLTNADAPSTFKATTAAHEWGHNFNRLHINCGGPASPDLSYPYAGTSIGVYGFDMVANAVRSPTTLADYMSYCSPHWTSDYTYNAVMNHRGTSNSMFAVVPAAPQRSLLIWGRISAQGIVLEPAFEITAVPKLPAESGPYVVEGLDESGARVFSLSFEGEQVDHLPGERHFSFVVPISQMNRLPSKIRLRANGREAERQSAPVQATVIGEAFSSRAIGGGRSRIEWNASAHPAALVRDATTGEVLSIARGGTVDFRSRTGNVEVVLSDGVKSTARSAVVPR